MKKIQALSMAVALAGAFSVAQAATCPDQSYGAISFQSYGSNKCVAIIDADGPNHNESIAITETIAVDSVYYFRSNATSSSNQTIVLPFDVPSGCFFDDGAQFLEIDKISQDSQTKKWRALLKNRISIQTEGLKANRPYILRFNTHDDKKLYFKLGSTSGKACQFNINTSNGADTSKFSATPLSGDWILKGTYEKVVFDDNTKKDVYGFASKTEGKFSIGQFVKAGTGASVPPMRAYLVYNSQGNSQDNSQSNSQKVAAKARAISSAEEIDESVLLPQSIDIVMMSAEDPEGDAPATVECFQDGDGIFEVKTINGRVTACIDDNGIKNAGHFSIPEEYLGQTVDSISYNRKFTPKTLATAIFPFDLELHNTINGTGVGRFVSIGQQDWDKQWVATFDWGNEEKNLKANTPYILGVYAATELRQDSTLIFCQSKQVACATIQAASDADAKTNHENWNFVGTYEKITFNESTKKGVYGFVAKQDTVDGKVFSAGQFVKAGTGASVPPMRAYLKYNSAGVLAKAAAGTEIAEEDLPETITVKFIDGDGSTTAIGTMNTITGEITMDENKWFDMKGRVLNRKPTAKGTYYNKGQKVIIK